jgi:hypothetical protein
LRAARSISALALQNQLNRNATLQDYYLRKPFADRVLPV